MATSTLAWGVNTPAHLVIIKGTEYFDAPSRQALRITPTRAQRSCTVYKAWRTVLSCFGGRYYGCWLNAMAVNRC